MNKVSILFLAIIGLLAAQKMQAADPISDELRRQWEASRNQILTLSEAIPEDKYDYKPTPEVRSFREQLQHLVGENFMFMGMVAGEKAPGAPAPESLKSRAEIMKALEDSYAYGVKVLAGLNDQKATESVAGFRGQQMPRFGIVIANMKDNHEHYGNLVTYIRLNGITPPRTAARKQQPPAR